MPPVLFFFKYFFPFWFCNMWTAPWKDRLRFTLHHCWFLMYLTPREWNKAALHSSWITLAQKLQCCKLKQWETVKKDFSFGTTCSTCVVLKWMDSGSRFSLPQTPNIIKIQNYDFSEYTVVFSMLNTHCIFSRAQCTVFVLCSPPIFGFQLNMFWCRL